ncbi:alpha/beta fold hydrolase [Ramlibacter sp. AW1]|uniref:Alpha/beta fold hydrolase n=1 Tax=Ramlibacter aurantiacus TaxID=2801330 RepID=A0A936ZMF6_9BURK|nr:alpha/beta fold hydrolase [Ramlibacter aurantiacus]MBL0418871.1 alpha/beta fold hydrolase [Ramlibacter aurantiacus]
MTTRALGIDIHVDGTRIAGTLVGPETMVPGVLLVHGWDGSQAQYLERAHEIARHGCICLTFDLRGHVRHKADRELVSREDNLRDLLAAYDALVNHPAVDPAAVALVGSSYGAYLAAVATSLRPVRWLSLRVPALYKDEDWHVPKRSLSRDELMALRRRVVSPEENRALAACAAFRGDVLIVESEDDPVVPRQTVRNYRDACSQARSLTYRLMQGADHGLSDPNCQKAYTDLLVTWMGEMVMNARAPQAQGKQPAKDAVEEAQEGERLGETD